MCKTEIFINKARLVHGNFYNYSKVNYIKRNVKIIIICPVHGEFEQEPRNHLKGQRCKKCVNDKQRPSSVDFINKAKLIHGDTYGYSKVKYINNKTKVVIICPIHGEFEQTPAIHLRGSGCLKCSQINQKKDINTFIKESKKIHGDKYDYSLVNYVNNETKIKLVCPIHGKFEQTPNNHLSKGHNCLKCSSTDSKIEKSLKEFLTTNNIQSIYNNRSLIKPNELDIYIPSRKIAIEMNGLRWHSELYKDKNYHLNKTELCEKMGVRLIHVFEDEWLHKQDIVKSRLRNILGMTDKTFYARKCEIREVPTKEKTKFLDDNHIQGAVGSKINLGLYYNNELVSVMTFGKRPILNKSEYELIRFCNKLNTSVVGGASKLLKYFIKKYNPKEVISYADRRWSMGNMYEKLGFEFIENTEPNWFIIQNNKRHHRVKYQKHKLIEMGFDENKTAHQICLNNRLYRIYDCGTKKYQLIILSKNP
jgi:hypothetical protein